MVYEAGFPVALRAPFEALLDVERGERSLALTTGAGPVLGLALVRNLPGTAWTFLRYFVIAAERRGTGLGGVLWRMLTEDLVQRHSTWLLFDVEDPDDRAASAGERAERERRVRFYQRLGASLLDVSGYQPPAHGEPGATVIPLRLMAARLGAAESPQPERPELADMVRAVYSGRYGAGPESPLVAATLRDSGL